MEMPNMNLKINIVLILLFMMEAMHTSAAYKNKHSIQKSERKLDKHERVQMGILDDQCDNGKDNLTVDWDGNPVNYTCFNPKNPIPVYPRFKPVLECEDIPAGYYPFHHCMNTNITYKSVLPTHDDHRPIWPVYGEYKFVPPQRWLHNVEHGGVILLYHPCANPFIVKKIKGIVKSCLRRYIITAYNRLPIKMPVALVAWGCRYLMNDIDVEGVVSFIRNHGLKGPEKVPDDGTYDFTLIEKSKIPPGSDFADSNLCPGQ